MKTRRLVFALSLTLFALSLGGCMSAIEMSSSTPAELNMNVANDRSPALHSGAPYAFWVWRDADGLWHLRTTAKRTMHRFQGRIRPLSPAVISDVQPVSLEQSRRSDDKVGMVGRDLAFNFTTTEKNDGFDFRVTGSACIEFDLRLDGDGDPAHIYLGKDQTKPASAHFILCP
ncbi:MAG: hypothetical protein V4773_13425 [Verrucomicrobiota bacterium]